MLPLEILRVGYPSLLKTLESILCQKRIPPVWLFSGPPGVGKYALVYYMSCLLAGSFASFQDIKPSFSLNHEPEFFHLPSPASVEDVRMLRLRFHQKAFSSSWRFIVIANAHMLNRHSMNALLCLMEQPPEKTFFFLTAERAILKTVFSRCLHHRMHPLPLMDFRRMMAHWPETPDHPLFEKLCQGCVGRAYELHHVFPLAQRTWDYLENCCQGPFFPSPEWLEEIILHVELFQEIFCLWGYDQLWQAYSKGYFLHIYSLLEEVKQLWRDGVIYNSDMRVLIQTIFFRLSTFFVEKKSSVPSIAQSKPS